MTRQYWTNHKHQEGLITDNRHIALLIIRNFEQRELPLDEYIPYQMWQCWLVNNPIRASDPRPAHDQPSASTTSPDAAP